MNIPAIPYPGGELALFAGARNWKRRLAAAVEPYLGARVLEVGAGIGGTTEALCRGPGRVWTCLEPDPQQAAAITARLASLPARCGVVTGTLSAIPADALYDSILYIDVLEHIADDAGELAQAARHLAPGGALVVVAPAHQWLFSPFDAAIGHHRRYSVAALARLAPPSLRPVRLSYMDCVGLLLSLANRLLLRSAMPTAAQVRFWDRVAVPLSNLLDPLVGGRLGKSVLAVWRPAEGAR